MLYLAWLLCVQNDEVPADSLEPPIPSGLAKLTAPLKALAEFLHIDDDLIAVAAERSDAPSREETSKRELRRWAAALPEAEKTELLVRVLTGEAPPLREELLRRYRGDVGARKPALRRRTVSEICSAAERRTEERYRKAAERASREEAHREREKAASRERYLTGLEKRESKIWDEIRTLIATGKPADYDEAVRLLGDLRDLGTRSVRVEDVQNRIRQLGDEHARKRSFVRRLKRAGLITSAER